MFAYRLAVRNTMSSDDSDDEPLAALATKNKTEYEVEILPVSESRGRKKKCFSTKKACDVTIELQYKDDLSSVTVERPTDVWLYLKDLNPNGPYSCLLCSEWFINKTKIVIHYVVNHKKDFCGICRYFVPDREAWQAHVKFHIPWQCSQCPKTFNNEGFLRAHFSQEHNLVHCRLCHTRLIDGDDYHTHLYQKHSVTNVSCKNEESFWEFEQEDLKFLCILCNKSNNCIQTFSNHYMAYHHLTLKCLAPLISGKNWNFPVHGAEVSIDFIDRQLKAYDKYGYLDLDKKPDRLIEKDENVSLSRVMANEFQTELVKEEALSEPDENVGTADDEDGTPDDDNDKNYEPGTTDSRPKIENNQLYKTYKGNEDFDTTQVEIIVIQKCYFDYVDDTLSKINSNLMPQASVINYGLADADHPVYINCELCKAEYTTLNPFTQHMIKMHGFKSVSTFSCRVCATTFDSYSELEQHEIQELGDFEDLWICQFCDKEFDDRGKTRIHLTEHWDAMEYDNCFSPHLGFKCKYCPTLFWNETDRETHLVKVHFQKYKGYYYKCESCDQLFSDKVWFIHHYFSHHMTKEQDPIGSYLLKCCFCCTVFPNVDAIRQHFSVKHPEAKRVFCSLDTCQYKPFTNRKSFHLHLKSYHVNKKRAEIYACQFCGKQFTSQRSCSAHTTQAHGPGRFSCNICKELLHTADERKIHYLLRHPGKHPFQCRDCDKSFQYKSSLYLHRKEHAPNKEDYECTYCGKIFKKRDSFREHVMIHEGPKHACSYCPMVFVQRSNMLRHERRHTGERPYACQFCPKTFSDKGACSSHSRVHQKMPAFPCMYCGQTFVQKSKLTYHIRKHTGENLETCPHTNCGKIFTSACSLREHMKTHEKKQVLDPVKCPLCSKSYQDEKYMMRHLRATHTNAEFLCPICKKKLHSAASLRDHVVTHSGSKAYKCNQCAKSYNVKRTMVRHLRRRHGLKTAGANLSEYYSKLDPRECNLNLDDETMNSIFGPPKRKLIDAVNFTNLKRFKLNQPSPGKSQSDDESETENAVNKTVHIKVECEEVEEPENEELQPTDFVSVKIECAEGIEEVGEEMENSEEEY